MSLLVLVSLIWAFSFGLIGATLQTIHPDALTWLRLALAAAVFAPFARRLPAVAAGRFAWIGAVQFGVMYVAYNWSFRFLRGHEVALLTVTTPFFVTALNDWNGRAFSWRNALLATTAVVGAVIVIAGGHDTRGALPLAGIALTQVSNLAFAVGQLAYRRAFADLAARQPLSDAGVCFYGYAGAVAVTLPFALRPLAGALPHLDREQALALLYLGTIASGLSFFLWNRGARFTSAGALAVMNNLKIPLAVAVSLLVFREPADLRQLLPGGGLVLAAAAAAHFWAANRGDRR